MGLCDQAPRAGYGEYDVYMSFGNPLSLKIKNLNIDNYMKGEKI